MASRSGTAKKKRAPARTREQLEEYRRKRHFGRTAEPSGDVETTKRRSGQLGFVIQKHAASHLHYDLRLELDGVMRSWAVPKGPSLDPAMKRLAMQVEDHPMDYNTFEGTIPKGEYGGGTVMLWDRGTYSPDEAGSDESDEDAVRRGLKAGKLSFTFHGERLRGSYALVRTERGPRAKWLLIKHRDEEVRTSGPDITEEVMTSVDTGRTMEEIAGESDRVWRSNRSGRTGGEEKRAASTAAPTIAPMKPTPTRRLPAKVREWSFEPWLGGERVLAYVTPDIARLADERSRDITAKHRAIAESLMAFAARTKHAFVLDGELAHKAFFVSDLLLLDADVLMDKPWRTRRTALEKLFHRRRVAHVKVQQTSDDGAALLDSAAAEGWPGIVAHLRAGTYEPGVRAESMLRISAA